MDGSKLTEEETNEMARVYVENLKADYGKTFKN
jgi:hypothetical protein